MPDRRRKNCQHCGGHTDEVGPISWSGLCPRCGPERMVENIVGISTKSGVAYQRFLIGTVRAAVREPRFVNLLAKAGAFTIPLDDPAPSP